MKPTKLAKLYSIVLSVSILYSLSVKSQVVEGIDYSGRAHVSETFDMATGDYFGKRFSSEHIKFKDNETGVEIIALTTSRRNSSKLYQTHPQWTPDGKYIVFTSRHPRSESRISRAYAVSMENYEIVQISSGEGGANYHLGWKKNSAWIFRENDLIELNLGKLLSDSETGNVGEVSDYEKVIASIPDNIRHGGLGLDANENRVFFSSPLGKDRSAVYSLDFSSGKTSKLLEVPFRIGHLQCNPFVSGEVMYCWETGGDAPQRMWYMKLEDDGTVENMPLYTETDEEWVTHEVFAGPDHVLFHVMGHIDRLKKNPTGIFSINIRSGESRLIGQVEGGGYWHCGGTSDHKWVVGDTFDGKLYRLNLEKDEKEVLLTQGHRQNSVSPFTSEAHLHPSISPDGKWVLINSSLLTDSDLMLLPLHPEKQSVLNNLLKVNEYLMKKWPNPSATVTTNIERSSNLWTRGTYYEGLMALHSVYPQDQFYHYAVEWGEGHNWQFRTGNDPHTPQIYTTDANHLCAAQTYIDLYEIDPQPERIKYVKLCIDSTMRSGEIEDWDWVDALQMAMPVYSKLARLYDNQAYLDFMHEAFMFTKEKLGGSGLYNPEDGLWWRDADFLPPYTEPNGEDCYWSRGNGWAYAAIVRAMEDMPKDYKHFNTYKTLFLEMSEALLKVQRPDGYWNVSLHDPDNFGGKELTGTLFFVYGMMWGVNHGLLDSDYLNSAMKAWNAVTKESIRLDGSLAYIQGTGKEPKDSQPVTYDSKPDFEDYGVGIFLLAGTEIYKYLSE